MIRDIIFDLFTVILYGIYFSYLRQRHIIHIKPFILLYILRGNNFCVGALYQKIDFFLQLLYTITMTQFVTIATLQFQVNIPYSQLNKKAISMINYFEFEVTPQEEDDWNGVHPDQPSHNTSQPHTLFLDPPPLEQILPYRTIPLLQQQSSSSFEWKEDIPQAEDTALRGTGKTGRKRGGGQWKRFKNETKNIPKNFGKGIISWVEKNDKKVKQLLLLNHLSVAGFKSLMRSEKKTINTIADLRRLWTDPTYGKCLRMISNLFFRRHALDYIFNSRISNYSSHIKYRQSLWMAIKDPHNFSRIKEF